MYIIFMHTHVNLQVCMYMCMYKYMYMYMYMYIHTHATIKYIGVQLFLYIKHGLTLHVNRWWLAIRLKLSMQT